MSSSSPYNTPSYGSVGLPRSHADPGHSLQVLVAVLEFMAAACGIPKFWFCSEHAQPHSTLCWTEPVLSPGVTAMFSADLYPVLLRPLWQAERWDGRLLWQAEHWDGWPTGADSVQHLSLVPASDRAAEHGA